MSCYHQERKIIFKQFSIKQDIYKKSEPKNKRSLTKCCPNHVNWILFFYRFCLLNTLNVQFYSKVTILAHFCQTHNLNNRLICFGSWSGLVGFRFLILTIRGYLKAHSMIYHLTDWQATYRISQLNNLKYLRV